MTQLTTFVDDIIDMDAKPEGRVKVIDVRSEIIETK